MPAQLELDLTRRETPAASPLGRKRLLAGARALLPWTPVWVPLLFLGQLVVLGLLPARAEKQRLDAAEVDVRARATALEEEERALAREARMLADGVFQERVRRSLVDPKAPPLTLEQARKRTGP